MRSLRYLLDCLIVFVTAGIADAPVTDDVSWTDIIVSCGLAFIFVGFFLLFRWVSRKHFKSWLATVMAWVFTIAAYAVIALGIIIVELIVTK